MNKSKLNIKKLREDFPIFNQENKIIYLDNAATTQKPKEVIDSISNYYSYNNAPIHRSVYKLAEDATVLYESARKNIANFLKAKSHEIIFTKNATEGINLVCDAWARNNLKKGDMILVSELEHHSNLLPWIKLSQDLELILKYIPIDNNGLLDYQKYQDLLNPKVKFVSCTATSNILGTKIDINLIINSAHNLGAKVLIDAAQKIPHDNINLEEIKPDFLVFSGHKMLGPTGIGVLYINENIQDSVSSYQLGGGTVFEVDYDNFKLLRAPAKFEAGTPPIAQAIGLSSAIDYINKNIDLVNLKNYEAELCSYLISGLENINNKKIKLIGPIDQLKQEGHMVSFIFENIHAHDIASYLDKYNICVRAGQQCSQPLHKKLNIDSSVRVSFYFYNFLEEIDKLLFYLKKL